MDKDKAYYQWKEGEARYNLNMLMNSITMISSQLLSIIFAK